MALRIIALTLLATFALISVGAAGYAEENNTAYKEFKNLSYDSDQRVSGTGFFSTYKYAFMPDALGPSGDLFNGAETKGKSHGSGTIDSDSKMYAESYYLKEDYFDAVYDEWEPYDENEDSNGIIRLNDDGKMTYSPISMAVGSRYYSTHPIVFHSLLKDDAWIKNRDNLNSMNYVIDRAHGIDRTLDINADYSETAMNADVNLIDGKAHFGVLELAGVPVDEVPEEDSEEETLPMGLAMKAWQKPLTVLDEDYIGTFHIIKRMTLTVSSEEKTKEVGWLPCCSSYGADGGWYDMTTTDRKGFGASTEGVFDCSCFKVPG
jgi:hypothetical protein